MKKTLETDRLILRAITESDHTAVQSWAGNSENVRYMIWGPNTDEDTKAFIKNAKDGNDFVVVLKENGAVIGSCGIYPNATNDTAQLGWILHKNYWKKGLGTELGRELIRYGFEDLALHRITAESALCNYGSWRVMERNKMRREGTFIKAFWEKDGKEWIDTVSYAILAEEWN